uniref:Oocyte-expressed protein homolog n=1 Tax=Felis catus TaxID=9685 RepID=A0ABI7XKV6_FELCA
MADDAGAAEAQGDQCTPAQSLGRLLKLPLPPPRIRTRPWWFPVQELRDPLVFYLEAWLADSIFGPDRAIIPEIEWMSQVLLTVDIVNSGDLVEITIFGRPRVQNRVKSVLLSLANWHRKHRARGVGGSRIPYIERVSKVMLELKVLESSGLAEVVVYGSYLYKLRAKWMLQSMAEWHRQRQERGMLKLEDAMKALHLGPWMK